MLSARLSTHHMFHRHRPGYPVEAQKSSREAFTGCNLNELITRGGGGAKALGIRSNLVM